MSRFDSIRARGGWGQVRIIDKAEKESYKAAMKATKK
jgi:hypothetical protein